MYNRLVTILKNSTTADWGRRLLVGFGLLTILLKIWYLLSAVLHNARFFNGPPIDGAFQLLDPLRRIADGQIMGRDFFFFHGPGLPFLHYPLYWLFGSNLYASILSQWVISLVFFVFSISWLLYVATKSWKVVVVGLSVCLVMPFLWDLVSPASTLLGIRSTMPLIIAGAIIYSQDRKISSIKKNKLDWFIATLLAVTFLFGIEHGFAAMVAMGTTYLITNGILTFQKRVKLTIATLLKAVAIVCAFVMLIGGKYGLHILRYSLIEVPSDQFWYFGVPPNPTLFEFKHLLLRWWIIPSVVLGVVYLIMLFKKARNSQGLYMASTFLIIYGLITLISLAAIYNYNYTQPYLRSLLLVTIIVGYRYYQLKKNIITSNYIIVVVGLILFILIKYAFVQNPMLTKYTHNSNNGMVVSGVVLSNAWSETVDILDKSIPINKVVWSTYAGVFEDKRQIFNSASQDYIIHALGSQKRKDYPEDFSSVKPDYALTIRKNYTIYEEWLQNENWQFYKRLILNYKLKAQSPYYNVWERTSDPWRNDSDEPWVNAPLINGFYSVSVPQDNNCNTILEVGTEYDIKNKFSAVPLIGDSQRNYIVPVRASSMVPISVPPYDNTWQFFLNPAQGVKTIDIFGGNTNRIPKGKIELLGVAYRNVPVDCATINALRESWYDGTGYQH